MRRPRLRRTRPVPHRIATGRVGRAWSVVILFALLLRGALRVKPRPVDTATRLRMLPVDGAPVRAPVRIRWNKHQIPAIVAEHDEDLFVALGVVHAHLRLAQLELLRRVATGRLSEIVGPAGLELDHAIRLLDVTRAVPAIVAELPAETRQLAEAFVSGINHVIAHAPEQPYEFRVLSMRPEPWTIEDAFAVQRLCATDMSWQIWQRLLPLRARVGTKAWRALWPVLLAVGAPASSDALADPVTTLFAATARHGSNSMAVSGAGRASGAAIIASDPHLPYSLPSPWIAVSMRSPGFDCAGLMMPSQPFLALGRNRKIAWGGTSLHAQSSDLFNLSAEPPDRFRARPVSIPTRGGATRRVVLREHAAGPVVSDGLQFRGETPMAMRWLGHEPSDELSAMLGVARATDWSGFKTSLRGFAVSGLNMVYADRDGHIGRLCAAHMPSRPAAPPDDLALPLSALAAWDEIVDTDALPSEYDPPDGVVVSANAKPGENGVPVGFFFSTTDRQERIRGELLAGAGLDARRIGALQRDVFSRWSSRLRDRVVELSPAPGNDTERALERALRHWDGCYAEGSHGAVAFTALVHGLIEAIGEEDAFAAHEQVWGVESFVSGELDRRGDAEQRFLVAQALRAAAIAWSAAASWGEQHRIQLNHPLSALPIVGKRFARESCASGGSNDTVCKSGHSFADGRHTAHYGSCARHVADLADSGSSFVVQLGGQDGWVGSSNANDQTELWRRGEYITLPLAGDCGPEAFPFESILVPVRKQHGAA